MEYQNDSTLKRLMLLMDQAFQETSHSVDPLKTERLAETLYQVMSARYRIFHTVEHVFNASEGMEGVVAFAALFHDVVYHQVDKRIHPLLLPLLSEFKIDEKTSECLLPDLQGERWLSIAGKVFGFRSGQTLTPFTGLNEFLSAISAARMLSECLTEWQIIQLVACIEATIPFRSQQDPKNNPFDQLRMRLEILNQDHQLKLGSAELDEAVRNSIALANQDICSFYSKDLGDFVSGTWNLLLENNPIFKNPLYTVIDYRKSLQKVHSFFSGLKADHVVHEWGGFPSADQSKAMREQVSLNLANAILYLDIKLVEITILEVLALSSGGDAPYFLLIGESTEGSKQAPIERFFKDANFRANGDMNQAVYYVLKQGRKAESSFDFNHSPVAAYLYESLTKEEVNQSIRFAQEFHAGKIDGPAFLKDFRPEIIDPIIKGVGEISWSRKP